MSIISFPFHSCVCNKLINPNINLLTVIIKITFSAVAPTQPSPETHPQPAPSRKNNERGALLGSIETFSVNKLKKAKTNDRSAPVL